MYVDQENSEVETTASVVEGGDDPAASTDTAVEEAESTQEEAEKAPKLYTEEQIDEMFRKRMGRTERKLEARLRQEFEERFQNATRPRFEGELTIDQFDTPEEYAEALAERKAEAKLAEIRHQATQREIDQAYEDRAEKIRDKEGFEDYDVVVGNPNLRITAEMALAIKASEVGPEVAYHLGKNPQEASRIASLNPILQAREIGKIEATIASRSPVIKKATSTPEPIKPVGARGSRSTVYDTTDPRSAETMSADEWIAAENRRIAKKHQ